MQDPTSIIPAPLTFELTLPRLKQLYIHTSVSVITYDKQHPHNYKRKKQKGTYMQYKKLATTKE